MEGDLENVPVPKETVLRIQATLSEMLSEIQNILAENSGYSAESKEFAGTLREDVTVISQFVGTNNSDVMSFKRVVESDIKAFQAKLKYAPIPQGLSPSTVKALGLLPDKTLELSGIIGSL